MDSAGWLEGAACGRPMDCRECVVNLSKFDVHLHGFTALAAGSVSCRDMWRGLRAWFQSWLLVGVTWHLGWLVGAPRGVRKLKVNNWEFMS